MKKEVRCKYCATEFLIIKDAVVCPSCDGMEYWPTRKLRKNRP